MIRSSSKEGPNRAKIQESRMQLELMKAKYQQGHQG
jgi:hypothetical protein